MAKKKEVVETSNKTKLKILIAFTDKYTNVEYKIGDVVEFDTERVNELLGDDRHLVMEI